METTSENTSNSPRVSKTALALFVFYALVVLGVGAWMTTQEMLSGDIRKQVIVSATASYNAPEGYYEYYQSHESGFTNKYFHYNMSRFVLKN